MGGFIVVASALLALCAPDYVKGAPSDLLKVRTNQCTYQLGTEKPKASPNPDWVLTVKDVSPGDGKTCWVQLTRANGNVLSNWVGCYAQPVLKVARICTWRWHGMSGKPKQYRIANETGPGLSQKQGDIAWKPVP